MSHINDSKIDLGGKKDRHEHIGEGKIGISGFKNFLFSIQSSAFKFQNFPLILETQHDKVKEDINKLKELRKKIYG